MGRMYLLLADGFEEVEALTPADYLRRAGISVKLVSVSGDKTVTGSHGIPVLAEMPVSEVTTLTGEDGLILPGGLPGATHLAASAEVDALLRKAMGASALICAICAAPALVLAPKGMLNGRQWTCYPGAEKETGDAARTWSPGRVVADENIITSRAAGTAGEWSVKIIEKLLGAEAGFKTARSVLLPEL
ncbi:MAG: DJ-1/PfpI family protein [Spirochaetaceae bacterium]|jgi:4-methyl-5(b-hydroxyethyl)-thiazole monophosphate biosynthesis|nr:DJ-1/PfpI family protein [Spirochaetaceae bacterium]